MAYCMLGIFNINIPLLYGERPRAFQRLQQEIIKVNNDTSIFAWDVSAFSQIPTWIESVGWTDIVIKTTSSSVLAPHPSYFQDCAYVTSGRLKSKEPYAFSNQGFQFCSESFSCCLDELEFGDSQELFVIDLGCTRSSHIRDQKKPIHLMVALRVDKPFDCGAKTFQRAWMDPKSLPQRAYRSCHKKKQFCVKQSLSLPSVQITTFNLDSYGRSWSEIEIPLDRQGAISRVQAEISGTRENQLACLPPEFSVKADIQRDTHECSHCKCCIA
jgi:hypothetical protein